SRSLRIRSEPERDSGRQPVRLPDAFLKREPRSEVELLSGARNLLGAHRSRAHVTERRVDAGVQISGCRGCGSMDLNRKQVLATPLVNPRANGEGETRANEGLVEGRRGPRE